MLQGDPLSPLLFLLVVDYLLRRTLRTDGSFVLARRRSSRNSEVTLSSLAYADDVASFAATQQLLSEPSRGFVRRLLMWVWK